VKPNALPAASRHLPKVYLRKANRMSYVVPAMPLIAHGMDNSCWWASGQILVEWRRRMCVTEITDRGPSLVSYWQ